MNKGYTYLYKEYFDMIRFFVLKNSGGEEDAKDLFQETIIVVIEKINDQHFDLSCKLKTYLYSVSRNLWLKKLRDNKETNHIVDFEKYDEIISIEDHKTGDIDDKVNFLIKSIKQLGESCQEILERFYFYKQSIESIATSMGYSSSSSAKNQKYKCLQKLKKIML